MLFYKRRTTRPIGGKTRLKIEAAREKLQDVGPKLKEDVQLPTPPDEDDMPIVKGQTIGIFSRPNQANRQHPLDSSVFPSGDIDNALEAESDLENGPPSFESQLDDVDDNDPLVGIAQATSYDFPNPGSMIASPASSNAADIGDDDTPEMDFSDSDDDDDNTTAQNVSITKDDSVAVEGPKTSVDDIDL